MHDMGNMIGTMGWFGGWFGWLFSVLIIVLIVWLVMSLVRTSQPESTDTTGTDALERAKERYAQGEIDRETFLQIKKDLAQH